MSRHDPQPALVSIAKSLSPYDQLSLIRLLADEFQWSDNGWASINAGCDLIARELLADNAAANGYRVECVA